MSILMAEVSSSALGFTQRGKTRVQLIKVALYKDNVMTS